MYPVQFLREPSVGALPPSAHLSSSSIPSIGSMLILTALRCTSLSSFFFCCTLVLLRTLWVFGYSDSWRHCFLLASALRALSSGMLFIHVSFSLFLSVQIFSAVLAHLLAAYINLQSNGAGKNLGRNTQSLKVLSYSSP